MGGLMVFLLLQLTSTSQHMAGAGIHHHVSSSVRLGAASDNGNDNGKEMMRQTITITYRQRMQHHRLILLIVI
jgi:hypothetical protein